MSFKYSVLLVIQLVLFGLFLGFVRYGEPKEPAKGFEGTHVMIFMGFGFLMTFLKKYCYSALGFNWLLAAIVIQWAMLCQNVFNMKNSEILITKHSLVEADIMSATVLITFGALLGFASGPQLILISLIEGLLGSVNIYLVVNKLKASDAGGSIAIHAFGAYFGLACSFALRMGRPKEKEAEMKSLEGPTYISDITATLGSIFLWIYWPSFNSAITKSDAEYDRAVVNTYLSLASATVTTFMVSSLLSHDKGKFDMVHVQNSTLAGGVAVGAVANMMISPGGAIGVGIGAGLLSVCGYKYVTPLLAKFGIWDTCGVNNLHGMPALFSAILSAIFASFASADLYKDDLKNVFPAMVDDGRTASNQALFQLAATGVTLGIALIGGFIAGLLAKFCRPLEEDELYHDNKDWEVPSS